MCGIAGGLFLARDRSRSQLLSVAIAMGQKLVHRGPDDEDNFVDPRLGLCLTHRRLAVIDISEKGRQPMHSADGRFVISYNGELYNTSELREYLLSRGRSFRGHSDTEVIVEGLAEFGPEEFLPKVNGMFAFAAYDSKLQMLWLARDRLGIKPLYYGFLGNSFLFASETNALRQHPDWQGTIDKDSVAVFLRNSYIPAPQSIYKKILKVVPGQLLSVDSQGRLSVKEYWSLRKRIIEGKPILNEKDGQKLLEDQLTKSVKQQMISDVPLGAFLSGGIDSSLVVATMVNNSPTPVNTFSIGFKNDKYNEAQHGLRVANILGTNHNELYLSDSDLATAVFDMAHVYDEPFADSSQVPTYILSKMTSNHVRVALSGDGGDELFAGYDRYFAAANIATIIERTPYLLRSLGAKFLQLLNGEQWNSLAGAIFGKRGPVGMGYRCSALLEEIRKATPNIYPILHGHWPNPNQIVIGVSEHETTAWDLTYNDMFSTTKERWQFIDSITYLPDDILTKVDRASMAHSLEVRVPFLDHDFVELAWRLPRSMMSKDGIRKHILREILLRYLPASVIDRPKKGFGIPIDDLLRGPLKEWTDDLVNPGAIKKHGLLDHVPITKIWKEHKTNKRNWGYWIWAIVMLQTWLDERS